VPNLGSLRKIVNYKTAFTITAVAFVGFAAVNLFCTNALSTEGIAVSETETKTLQLEKENQIISVKIEEANKLKNIEMLAQSRGFVRSKNIVFVPQAPTFAQR